MEWPIFAEYAKFTEKNEKARTIHREQGTLQEAPSQPKL
jgi:hypothetical protein